MTMGNEILEATLVESDDDLDSSEGHRSRRRRDADREPTRARSRDNGFDTESGDPGAGEVIISGRVRKAAIIPEPGEEGDEEEVEEEGPDEDPDPDFDDSYNDASEDDPNGWEDEGNGPASRETEPRVKKGQVVEPPLYRKPVSEGSTVGPFTMMQIAVVGVVALLLLAVLLIFILPEEETDYIIVVPGLRVGDEGRYSVSGSIDIKDAHNEPIADEITEGWISLGGSSMVVEAEGITTVTDGYYRDYSALQTYSLATWDIDGWVDTISYGKVNVDGTVQINSDAYRNGNTILLTDMVATTDITAESQDVGFYSKRVDSTDTLRTYSSDSGDLQANFDEVIHTPNLRKGMKGEFENDDVAYTWEVTGNARVFKTDCVIVTFTVSKPTDDRVDSQSIKLYLSSKHPFPVKNSIEVVLSDPNEITVKYTMTMNQYKEGTDEIIIPEDEIIDKSPYLEERTMKEYPPTGEVTNTSISYKIEEAHQQAIDKSPDLRDYLDEHDDAFLVQGIYNETDGPVWNLTYSFPGSDTGYVVLVTESRITDKGEMKLSDIGYLLEVNEPHEHFINSWAGAEQILKHDDDVKEECFDGGEHLNLHNCNLAVRTRLYQPSVDFVSMFVSAPRVDYGYVVTKGDEFAAGVDAKTGQLLFVATHDGPDLF